MSRLAKEMRDTPEDFQIETVERDGKIICEIPVKLGFTKSADEVFNRRCLNALRHSVWQALEMQRLGEPLDQ